jgi:hypothetical protein
LVAAEAAVAVVVAAAVVVVVAAEAEVAQVAQVAHRRSRCRPANSEFRREHHSACSHRRQQELQRSPARA